MKVRTMRGEMLDMSMLVARNEKTIALGNASMNARGDIVGPRGNIIKRREKVAQDYYAANPKAVKQVALRDISKEIFVSPSEAAATAFGTPSAEVKSAAPSTPRKRKIEDRDE